MKIRAALRKWQKRKTALNKLTTPEQREAYRNRFRRQIKLDIVLR